MLSEDSTFGLKQSTIKKINAIFTHYSAIEQVIVYGSRAKGTEQCGSDIDLTLVGHLLNYDQLIKIETELDDLLLPYKIDLSIYHQIDNSNLIAHIDRVGKVFFHRNKEFTFKTFNENR